MNTIAGGSNFIADTDVHNGIWKRLECVEAVVFEVLESPTIGGDLTTLTLVAGQAIDGLFSKIKLTSGKLVAYHQVGMVTPVIKYQLVGVVLVDAGSDYAVDDSIVLVGGVFDTAAELVVTGETDGALDSVDLTANLGVYTTVPTNPVSTETSGSGTGATFNATWSEI